MADFTALKTAIQANIRTNGNEEITGAILQDVLLSMVTTMGDGAINALAEALQSEITNRQNAVGGEATTRAEADSQLSGRINAEATARGEADTLLQNAINGITTRLNEGYVYAGIATTSTNPGTPAGKVFYIALQGGTYTNFSSLAVTQGINILKYNGSAWSLEQLVAIDDEPTAGSNNLVKSGGIAFFNYDFYLNGKNSDLSSHEFNLIGGNKYRLWIEKSWNYSYAGSKIFISSVLNGTKTTIAAVGNSEPIPSYIDFVATKNVDNFVLDIRANIGEKIFFAIEDISYIDHKDEVITEQLERIHFVSDGTDKTVKMVLAKDHYYRVFINPYTYTGSYQKFNIAKVVNGAKTYLTNLGAADPFPDNIYFKAEACDYYEFFFRSASGEAVDVNIVDVLPSIDSSMNFNFRTDGYAQKMQFITEPDRWYRIKITNPAYTYSGVGSRFLFVKVKDGSETIIMGYGASQEVAQDEILFYSENADYYYIQIRATSNQTVGFSIDDVTERYLEFNNDVVIDNEFSNLGAADAGFVVDDDYGIAAAHYLCGDDGYGERHQKTEIAWFPVTQPERSKTAIVTEIIQIDGCNAIYIGNGVVRCIYTNQAWIWYKYKDFNVRTGEFVGDEGTMKMYDSNNNLVDISDANMKQYIVDSGISLPANVGTALILTSKVKKMDGKYYGTLTGYDNYFLIWVSTDMVNLKILSIVQQTHQYEADVRVTESKMQVVFRKSDGIYYTEADFDPSDNSVGTWSTPIKIRYSVDARPRIIDYNGNRMIIVTYNAGVICNNFPKSERCGMRVYVGDNQDPNDDSIIYEIGSKYAITYPDMFINYDEMYVVHGSEKYGLYAKHVGHNTDLAGKDCVCFKKVQL